MAWVNDMLKAQISIIHALWEAGKIQNEVAVLVRLFQSQS